MVERKPTLCFWRAASALEAAHGRCSILPPLHCGKGRTRVPVVLAHGYRDCVSTHSCSCVAIQAIDCKILRLVDIVGWRVGLVGIAHNSCDVCRVVGDGVRAERGSKVLGRRRRRDAGSLVKAGVALTTRAAHPVLMVLYRLPVEQNAT